jgi:hypothetical protein
VLFFVVAGDHRRQRVAVLADAGMSVMKPSRPWLMPTSGRPWRASSRAMPSMVPSPPTTTARSQRWPSWSIGQHVEVGDAGGLRGLALERHFQAQAHQEMGDLLQHRADAPGLVLAHDGGVAEALTGMRGITP